MKTSENDLIQDAWYLRHNHDVAAAGVNPDTHYETWGWHEGRDPDALFDTSWYLAKNPDVAQAGVDPLWHYDTYGWHEGRDPGPGFDSSDYLQRNHDVAAAGMDPLAHYLLFGQAEGRHIDPAGTTLATADPPHTIIGTAGDDTLVAAAGDNLIAGGAGNDTLFAGNGNDQLHGGAGNDDLEGGLGHSKLYGGSGNDSLVGGPGEGSLWGGSGADSFRFHTEFDNGPTQPFGSNEVVDFQRGHDQLVFTWNGVSGGAQVGFEFFDSNHNGRTDPGDAGISEVGGSTVVNVKAAWAMSLPNVAAAMAGENIVTVDHVVGLMDADFAPTFVFE